VKKALLISLVIGGLFSCGPEYTPKQKGYNRIEMPEHSYYTLADTFPYSFQVSELVTVEPHKSPYATKDWIDLKYYEYNAEIQITYIPIENAQMFASLLEDAYTLTSKHQIKASAIDRYQVITDKGESATLFELEGDVPSQFQFFVTDSTQHFLRGALYFRTATKNDSLAPVIEYIKEDALKLVNTLEWKD
jgi:gliding motility-associated lipoprotein GldD